MRSVKVIDQTISAEWALYNGDSMEVMKGLEDDSVDLSVFSPPFASLYTYSSSERDLGNSKDYEQFFGGFAFLTRELLRATKPGRIAAVHCQDLSTTKATHGVIGLRDFPGDIIRAFVKEGWVYDGRVTIDKDPQAQAIRTHSKALLFVQLEKDSTWSRPAMADYIVRFRKPGENAVQVKPDLSRAEWILWARPIWQDIRESDTLNAAMARDEKDERHICPLQLGTIERCVRLWSNPGEVVLSPFAGIGSEGVQSLKLGRKFIGCELKESYYKTACHNLKNACRQTSLLDLLEETKS
jgi:DNA modification methylase